MSKPLVVELYAGSFGWSAGFLAEGWRAIGVDIEHLPHHGPVPDGADLILQDVRTLHGSQFKDAAAFACSPPCQAFSWMAMPWSLAKKKAAEIREDFNKWYELTDLFVQCFRIQMEASKAAGRYIPMIVENVRGAQPWIGRAKANYGSYFLWGDVNSIGGRIVGGSPSFGMSLKASRRKAQKRNPDGTEHPQGSWFALADSLNRGIKAGDRNIDGKWTHSFDDSLRLTEEGRKMLSDVNESIRQSKSPARWTNPEEHYFGRKPEGNSPQMWKDREGGHFDGSYGLKLPGNNSEWEDREVQRLGDATKNEGSGSWFGTYSERKERWAGNQSLTSSKSNARKAASAAIARIPFPLALHIAKAFKPI